MSEDRLQKILARSGMGSRRAAEEIITGGRVTVNGRVATLGDKADPEHDAIKVDGKRLHPPKEHHYLLLNKPRAVMSTTSDPEGRPTVLELVPPGLRKAIVPVGRLDFLTEGLILLTDDGDFAQRVAHPRYGCTKTYEVKVRGTPDDKSLERLRRGIVLEGERTRPAAIDPRPVKSDTGNSWWIVELGQGRTRQIREMFKRIGHPVMKLRRVAIGPVRDPDLAVGQVRELSDKEVEMLRRAGKHRARARAAKARAEQEGAGRKGPKKGRKRKKATGKKHEGEAASRAAGKSAGKPAGRKAGTAAGKKGKAASPHRRETEASAEPRGKAKSGQARDRRPPGSGRAAEGEAVQGSSRRRSGSATGGGEEAADRPQRGAPGHTGGDRRARRPPGSRAGGEAGEAGESSGRGAGGRRPTGRGSGKPGGGGARKPGAGGRAGEGGRKPGAGGGGKRAGGSGRKPGGGGGHKPSGGRSTPGGRGGKGGRGGSGGRGGGGRR